VNAKSFSDLKDRSRKLSEVWQLATENSARGSFQLFDTALHRNEGRSNFPE
jgi:hypothetical protein